MTAINWTAIRTIQTSGAAAPAYSAGARVGIAAVGLVLGLLPGGFLLYLMARRKTREAATAGLSDVAGLGWSSGAQRVSYTVLGIFLTLFGLFLIGLAIWPPAISPSTSRTSHDKVRGLLLLSNPWAWVVLGVGLAACLAWAYLSRDDGIMKEPDPLTIDGSEDSPAEDNPAEPPKPV